MEPPAATGNLNRWYDRVADLLEHAPVLNVGASASTAQLSASAVAELTQRAPALYTDLVDKQKRKRKSYQDDKLTEKVMRSGTMGDKIAAMALVVGDFPVDSLHEFERLVSLAHSKSRREANLAQDAVRDLLVESLLPSHRRLQTMETSLKQNAHLKLSNELLAMFWFEHQLKQKVFEYAQALQNTAVLKRDELPHHRKLALQRTYDIVNEKPECEVFLLNILCSVGHGKHTSMNFHLLRKLVQTNPQFQLKICQLLEAEAGSSNAAPSAQYDICCHLNQTVFHQTDAESQALANRLMETYFSLFARTSTKSEAEQETKLLSAILTGVNRAFPYADRKVCAFKQDELMRVVERTALFTTKTQALMLLFRMNKNETAAAAGSNKDDEHRERLYELVYDQVKTTGFVQSRKKQLFLNLLVQVLTSDTNGKRAAAQLTSLMQAALLDSASLTCAATFLCSHVMQKRRAEHKQQHTAEPGWEYDLGRRHYHPTCVAFAGRVLTNRAGDVVEYSGDPLLDFGITNFLDKFIYRNPKEKKAETTAFGVKGRVARVGAKAFGQAAVNSEEFHDRFASAGKRRGADAATAAKLGEESELVFYNYFDTTGKKLAAGAARGRDVDVEAMEDEFADQLAEKLLKKSAGGAEFDMDEDEADDFERQLRREMKMEANQRHADQDDDEDEDEEAFAGQMDDEDGEEPDLDGEFDDDSGMSDFDDDEDEDGSGGDDDDDEDEDGAGGGGLSVFADADDFAGLIDGSDEVDDYEKYVTKKKQQKSAAAAAPSSGKKRGAPAAASASKGGKNNNSSKRRRH